MEIIPHSPQDFGSIPSLPLPFNVDAEKSDAFLIPDSLNISE